MVTNSTSVPKLHPRIKIRFQGGIARYYGEFRDYAPEGGGREALRMEGHVHATTDPDIANILCAQRLVELEERRARRVGLRIRTLEELKPAALAYVKYKRQHGRKGKPITPRHLDQVADRLEVAIEFLGEDTPLISITVEDVAEFCAHLTEERGVSSVTARKFLNDLSGLYSNRIMFTSVSGITSNPVANWADKPSGLSTDPGEWLENDEAADLLEAARLVTEIATKREKVDSQDPVAHMAHALLATLLYTGGRKEEVFSLPVRNIDFRNDEIHIAGTKTPWSDRYVPLWPALKAILLPYVASLPRSSKYLFPSHQDASKPLLAARKTLKRCVELAELRINVTPLTCRHTYCSTRLQTTKSGAPIALLDVAREMGHNDTDMIQRVYGHVMRNPRRSDTIEYLSTRSLPK